MPDGAGLIAKSDCLPSRTFHPKLFILSGRESVAVISGSGNLSANGMRHGCECGSLFIRREDQPEGPDVNSLTRWYDLAWDRATDYEVIMTDYERICRNRARKEALSPTDDDVVPPKGKGKGLNPLQLQQLRTFDNLWIDGGALGANYSKTGAADEDERPGNQLDMRRMTRVFFGAATEDLPLNETIAKLSLIWNGEVHVNRTLKYGNNTMDKLNVPPTGDLGPMFYKGKTLLFTRKGPLVFEFVVGETDEKRKWHSMSRRTGVVLPSIGQREWGVF